MDDKKLRIEVRLETKELERRLVSQIIWFHPDELEDPTTVATSASHAPADAKPTTPAIASPGRPTATRVQALRSDGVRLTFTAEQFTEQEILSGKSDVLGACRADVSQVDQLLIGDAIEKAAAELAYHKWKLHHATQPKFALDDDGESPADRTPGTESPLVGKPAPDFTLDTLGGDKFHLADSKGKIVVLDFWATWCRPCLQTMPQVERVVSEFNDQVQLIAVNLEESSDQITSTLELHKLKVTTALDRDGVVAHKYAVTAIPQTVIIDRAGNVARLYIGGSPNMGDQLREAIKSLIASSGTE
jgi:thiol-disulfide isomerase/thioredoxin